MTVSIDIVGEMSHTQYEALVRFVLSKSTSFSIVVRHDLKLNTRGTEFLRKLEPYLIRKIETDSWPGTTLLNATATVLYYRCDQSIGELLTLPETLYHWQQPDFPEDLSFYMSDGRNWFCTIAHEHDAFFESGFFAKEEILAQVPGIALGRRAQMADE